MAKRKPWVPLPAHTRHAKSGPSKGRDPHYKVHSTNKGQVPAIRCKECKDLPPIRSNASIVSEM